MLTPRFELSQTDNEITIILHAPYANIKDTVTHVDGTDFRFYSTPYYLRLNLPGEIVENDDSTGNYDCEKGIFTLKFSKVHRGEYFSNLDMVTTLLVPSSIKKNHPPTIEVIDNHLENNENDSDDSSEESDEHNISTYDIKGNICTKENSLVESTELSLFPPKYGFGNKISGSFYNFETEWIQEIIDLPLPDKTLEEDRKKLREEHEYCSFNEDHYMADLMEVDIVEPYLSYTSKWENVDKADIQLDVEKDLLKELPNKEYLLDENETTMVLYSMVDILYASCYNQRTTFGENNVESGWTINKLSSTLSWFQNFSDIHDVVLSSVRRSLCYPLVRNWDVSMKVLQDTKRIIKLGKKCILKQFCEIHSLFNNSHEPRYILNQLYIKDYLIWLQKVSDSKIEKIYTLLDEVKITKEELKLSLIEIEVAAYSVQNEYLDDSNKLVSLSDDLKELNIDDRTITK